MVICNNRSYFNDELHQENVARTRGREVKNRWIGLRMEDPVPNIASLESAIRAHLPDPALVTRNVSVRMEERLATVSVSRALWPEEEPSWAAAAVAIREETGFRMEFVVQKGTTRARKERDPEGKLEIIASPVFEAESVYGRQEGASPDAGGRVH